jgi:hypothetical protein
MAAHKTRVLASLTIVFGLLCGGCPTPPGGDKAIWQKLDMAGTGEVVAVAADADGNTEISLKWIYPDGEVDEKIVEGLKLADIADLPEGYEVSTGDRLPLIVEIRWKGKASVGPPHFWRDRVDERKITCIGPVSESDSAAREEDDAEDEAGDDPDGEITQLIWETTGGGQIEFTVTPDGDNYQIHLASYSFRDLPLDLKLKADDGAAYQFVKAIFAKEHDIHDNTFTPRGATGSWTSITLVGADGSRTKVNNIRAWGELSAVYDFVDKVAKQNAPKPELLPDDGPEPPVVEESHAVLHRGGHPSQARSVTRF